MSNDATPIHESQMEAMWARKEAEDLRKLQGRKAPTGDPKVKVILQFLREHCQLKVKASWGGKTLYAEFQRYVAKNPCHTFYFTNHGTGNMSLKSSLKEVCDQVFPYKNFKTKHYYIKTNDHIEFIKSQLANESIRLKR